MRKKRRQESEKRSAAPRPGYRLHVMFEGHEAILPPRFCLLTPCGHACLEQRLLNWIIQQTNKLHGAEPPSAAGAVFPPPVFWVLTPVCLYRTGRMKHFHYRVSGPPDSSSCP